MDMGIYSIQAACMAAGDATCVAVTAKEHPAVKPEVEKVLRKFARRSRAA